MKRRATVQQLFEWALDPSCLAEVLIEYPRQARSLLRLLREIEQEEAQERAEAILGTWDERGLHPN